MIFYAFWVLLTEFTLLITIAIIWKIKQFNRHCEEGVPEIDDSPTLRSPTNLSQLFFGEQSAPITCCKLP